MHVVQANIVAVLVLLTSNSELTAGTFLVLWYQRAHSRQKKINKKKLIREFLTCFKVSLQTLSSHPPVKQFRDAGELTILTLIT